MALVDEIAVKLGLKTTEFNAALKAAGASVQKFKDSGGGGESKIEGLFGKLEHRIFGLQHLASAVAVGLGLNFEHIAESLARFITGVSKEEEENLKKLVELSDKLVEVSAKLAESRLTDEQKLQLALRQREQIQNRLYATETKTTEGMARAKALEIQLDEKIIDIEKMQNDIRDKGFEDDLKWYHRIQDLEKERSKEKQENLKKEGEEAARWYKQQVSMEKQLHDLKFTALSPEKQLAQLEAEQLALVKKIRDEKAQGVDTLPDEIELQKNLNEQEKIRAALVKSTAESEAEIAAAKKKALEAEKNSHISIVGVRGGNQFNDASDAALAEVARRNRSQAQVIQSGVGGFGLAQNLEVARLLAEALNAEKELAFRRNLQSTIQLGGVDAARRSFAGDPLQFDRVLAQFNEHQDKSATLLQSLDDRLQTAGFGRR